MDEALRKKILWINGVVFVAFYALVGLDQLTRTTSSKHAGLMALLFSFYYHGAQILFNGLLALYAAFKRKSAPEQHERYTTMLKSCLLAAGVMLLIAFPMCLSLVTWLK